MHRLRWTVRSATQWALVPPGYAPFTAEVARDLDAAGIVLTRGRAVLLTSAGPLRLSAGEVQARPGGDVAWEPLREAARACLGEPTCHEPPPERPPLSLLGADGVRWCIGDEPVLVGRHPGCDVVIADGRASAYHCALAREDGGVRVIDLGSTNGTAIDGVTVQRGVVDRRAALRVGRTHLELVPMGGSAALLALPSPAMQQLVARATRLAPSRAPVLIWGESGVGKELLARFIHDQSGRRGAFVALNSAVLQKALASSELFGHLRGAFTGADRDHDGAFAAADGGTLFLDEIGELSAEVQAELLRAVELGKVRRLGDTREQPVDVRIVAATHRDLAGMVRAGRFREDLYHRLCVLPLTVPPLRERPQDIDALVDGWLAREQPYLRIAATARDTLRRHAFAGNVRELLNVLRRAAVFCDGEVLEPKDLELTPARVSGPEALDDLIAEQVLHCYRELGNVTATANRLGLRRAVVQRVLRHERRAARQQVWPKVR